jgi:nucleoid-associated protein EbfC
MDIKKLMKQAQQMQAQVEAKQNELAEMEVTGNAGSGQVAVTMNGKHEVTKIVVNPEVIDPEDVDFLQDMLIAAFNDAVSQVTKMTDDEMGSITGGMSLPGM